MSANLDVVVRILSIGSIGLGFLLAYLAYRLLNKEQSIDKPRNLILNGIYRFMIFSFGLCILGFSSEIYRVIHPAPLPNSNDSALYWPTPDELQMVRKQAEEFLMLVDKKDYQQIYASYSSQFRAQLQFSDFERAAINYDLQFGLFKGRKFMVAIKGMGGAPDGQRLFYQVYFVSHHELIPNTGEMVTLSKADDGTFKVWNFIRN